MLSASLTESGVPASAHVARRVIIALVASAPEAIAIARIPQAGSRVRDAMGYPTAPNPIANAAIAGKLKNGDGARVRLRRRCSTPCSIAKTASNKPAMKAATNRIASVLIRKLPCGLRRQESRYFRNHAIVAGQAAVAAAMFAPFMPVCWRKKPWPAPGKIVYV